ncbi:MAG: sensor histidine kinase KdpD [Rhodospirillum sp.]|nr:sensor histidine kinase KdpD [Rhodospirillum sp.]MCF8490253.1 sensor histidine kinase KdpD [Rhodospirillum sp.]MCF8501250.1 sensor histidine kinase KdpD [Rhodospirillum sp.]
MADEDGGRPEPEALLKEVRKDGRGRLKIFLGAAPGVGKTYAMLQAAHERRKEGLDVLVAVVETHGRQETEALVRGLPVLPRKRIGYRGRVFTEMDLDALLQRKPKLVLIDELAHTNVGGSRHVKRWRDVEEVLGAGIDVYATLNIQHLESLNDIVERIAKVRVRETLPDAVLEVADEIELVDLPPDALVQRLVEGKVYVPEQARRAARHFFSRGNLTALRELAMRTAAERVDRDMLDHMRAHAVPGPWPARDRLMVCLDDGSTGPGLVRAAKRMAERARIPWIAVHVETRSDDRLDEASRGRLEDTLLLAQRLGAEVETLRGSGMVARDLVAHARARNVTGILVGRTRRPAWRRWFGSSVPHGVLRLGRDFEVTVTGVDDASPKGPVVRAPEGNSHRWLPGLSWATAAVALAGVAAWLVERILPLPNLSLVFLTAVLFVAMRLGLWPALYAVGLSLLVYNFFFTVPFMTFTVYHRADILTLMFFVLVAVITGNLAGRVREQLVSIRQTARRTANLYAFSRKVVAVASLDDVLWASVHHVASTLSARSLVLLPGGKGGVDLDIAAGYPPEDHLSDTDRAAADWAWKNERPAGWGTDTLPGAGYLFMPLRTGRGMLGLLGVAFERPSRSLSMEQRSLLAAVADQSAVAIERSQLSQDIEEARLLSETENLRSALLSSLSHDLRTPLVSIIGSATTLSDVGERISPEDRRSLVDTVLEEANRLNRFVQNLLDMTRLGYGALRPRRDWTDPVDVVGRAVHRLGDLLAPFQVRVDMAPDAPLLFVDPVLIEQVLVNILDNAAKHSPADGLIRVEAGPRDGWFRILVEDDGPGIPPDERELVFDMFYRVKARDSRIAGTGLGLSICRGLVEAHGGSILAEDGRGQRGAAIVLRLPLDPPPCLDASETESEDGTGKIPMTDGSP